MPVRFLHAADVHLGFQQYGEHERFNDFARTFGHLVDTAIAQGVHFVVLAGDLFHKHAIGPQTALHATHHLERLRQAGVACYAIEGNHDRPLQREAMSWIQFLAESDLLVCLDVRYDKGVMQALPYDAGRRSGAIVDRPDGVRLVGMQYMGASTGRAVRDLAACLAEADHARYTVLLLHCGLQGVLDNYQAVVTRSDLEILRPHVDYVALGHIHKPFQQDDWLFNPGSIETNSAAEVAWLSRGYLLVEVDGGAHEVTTIPSLRRPFLRLTHRIDTYTTPEALLDGVLRAARQALADEPADQPVVWLALTGTLRFERANLDLALLQETLLSELGALVCQVKNETTSREVEIANGEALSRPDLERQVLLHLAARDARREPLAAEWATLAQKLKALALSGQDPEQIIAEIEGLAEGSGLLAAEATLASAKPAEQV
jgi:DNA repair exonuclease SbcCD nuclease subunit